MHPIVLRPRYKIIAFISLTKAGIFICFICFFIGKVIFAIFPTAQSSNQGNKHPQKHEKDD